MKEYTYIDRYLHRLSQLIAKANRTYVPAKDDDSHTNLYYDALGHRILGRWMKIGDGKLILSLNLDMQTLEILDAGYRISGSIELIGKSVAQLERWVQQILLEQGLDPAGYSEPMHFEIPEYGFGKEPIKQLDHDSLARWGEYRGLSNQACSQLCGHLQVESEARIWPHHFDTGIYMQLNEQMRLGFGLAMEDEMVSTPYFYLSPNFSNDRELRSDFPESCYWRLINESSCRGAALLLTIWEDNPHESGQILDSYLRQTTHWMLQHLQA
jgi:hypothetical protein